jgi:hypothetical protein
MSDTTATTAAIDRESSSCADDDVLPTPEFALTSLLTEARLHPELDLLTLTYHTRQSDATARDGYWHASINEARSVLEALVVSIVQTIGVTETRRDGIGSGTAFSHWRRFLVAVEFIDTYESDVLHFVYGLSSVKGSHHGVPDERWCRLARRLVFCAADYVLGRYGEWKQRAPQDLDAPPSVAPSPTNRQRLGTWIRQRVASWRPRKRRRR